MHISVNCSSIIESMSIAGKSIANHCNYFRLIFTDIGTCLLLNATNITANVYRRRRYSGVDNGFRFMFKNSRKNETLRGLNHTCLFINVIFSS
jgi:hypothetical protein